MTTIKYNGGKAACPKCNGQLSYDASITQKLPIGFGFVGGSKFQIDFAISKGWRGECMDCFCKVFAVVSTRHGVKFPVSLNRKLAEMAVQS